MPPSTASNHQYLEEELRSSLTSKDGLLQAFFSLLWAKTADQNNAIQGVRIPDTAVLDHSRVIEYYFTSVKDGTIRKKSKANQNSAHLLEELAKRVKKNPISGMAATLICRDPDHPRGVRLEPMTLEETKHRLENESNLTGVVQGFIEPHSEGGKYFMHDITVNWTPNLFYAEKRTSPAPIPSKQKSAGESPADRQQWFSTGDDNPGVTASSTLSSYSNRELERMCVLIAQHMEGAFRMKLMGLFLHATVDAKDQLWITYCSGLKLSRLNALTTILIDARLGTVSRVAPNPSRHRESSVTAITTPSPVPRSSSTAPSLDTSLDQESHTSRPSAVRRRLPPRGGSRLDALYPKKPLFCFCRVCTACNMPPHVEEAKLLDEEGEPPFDLDESMRYFAEVPRKHVQFSLSVMSFFATHKPGTLYEDESLDPRPTVVPTYVQLIRLNDHRCERQAPRFYKRLRALGIKKASDGRLIPGVTPSQSRSGTPSSQPPSNSSSSDDDENDVPEEVSLEEYLRLRDTDSWHDERIMVCDECARELTGVVEDAEIGKDGQIRVPANPFGSEGTTSPVRLGRYADGTATSNQRRQKPKGDAAPSSQKPSPYAASHIHANAEQASRVAKSKAIPTTALLPHSSVGESEPSKVDRAVVVSTPDGDLRV